MSSKGGHKPRKVENHRVSPGVGKLRPAGRMQLARPFHLAHRHLQKLLHMSVEFYEKYTIFTKT